MKNNFWKKLKSPILALAPMAGVTDSAFRQICQENGADVVYSEMASVSALFFNPKKTLELIKFNEKERPYVVQLFGNNPLHFAKATQIINSLPNKLINKSTNKPDGIDINFGCPAKKVFGHGSGCALMPQKKLAREIISAVISNTDLPVSIKIRAGIGDVNAIEFIKNVKDLDFQAVMVHGRTYEGKFTGQVDFKLVEEIKKIIPDKIVLANGGITTAEIGAKILQKYSSLDGLGIARGTFGQPWIFDEIKKMTCHCEESRLLGTTWQSQDCFASLAKTSSIKKVKQVMLHHAELLWKDKKEKGMFEVRKHLAWYIKGFPGASEIRQKLVLVKNPKEIKKILNKIK